MSAPKAFKCVVIGDGCVGKTCMVACIAGKEPNLEEFVPTIIENTLVRATYKDQQCSLEVWNVAGQEDYKSIHLTTYTSVDAFLACFSLIDRSSFNNVENDWLPEVRKSQGTAKVILIGTKLDLCTPGESRAVRRADIDALCARHGFEYVQCSSVTRAGIQDVLDRTLQVLHGDTKAGKKWKRRSRKRLKSNDCSIL